MLGRFTTPDPASDPGWNLQLYGLGDPLNLYDPEGLGVVSTLVRLFGDEQINQFSDADLDAAYGNDKDVLMGMSYGARNAITLGFYADYESPDEFAKRNGCKADTAAFAAASIATEFACDFALSAATGGAAGAIKGGLKVAQTTRRIAKAWQAAQWTSDAVHAAKGVVTYSQTGDATQLLGAAGMAGSHALGRVFSATGRVSGRKAKVGSMTVGGSPRQTRRLNRSTEVIPSPAEGVTHGAIRFHELSGGAKQIVRKLRWSRRAKVGSGIKVEDFRAASEFMNRELGIALNSRGSLVVVRGRGTTVDFALAGR
ncbi:MAG: hypothetical protein IT463_09045 [Planctomycetes bacterium]|nr:hypothetical protein [Planctomycetota bacterium]